MLTDLLALLQNPLFWLILKVLLAEWVFTAAVTAMPMPQPTDSRAYTYLFTFLHSLAGSVNRAAIAFKVPGSPDDKQ